MIHARRCPATRERSAPERFPRSRVDFPLQLHGRARRFQRQLSGVGVEVEQLPLATPLKGNVKFSSYLFFGESTTEQIDEEPFTKRAILGRTKTPTDGAYEWCA